MMTYERRSFGHSVKSHYESTVYTGSKTRAVKWSYTVTVNTFKLYKCNLQHSTAHGEFVDACRQSNSSFSQS